MILITELTNSIFVLVKLVGGVWTQVTDDSFTNVAMLQDEPTELGLCEGVVGEDGDTFEVPDTTQTFNFEFESDAAGEFTSLVEFIEEGVVLGYLWLEATAVNPVVKPEKTYKEEMDDVLLYQYKIKE